MTTAGRAWFANIKPVACLLLCVPKRISLKAVCATCRTFWKRRESPPSEHRGYGSQGKPPPPPSDPPVRVYDAPVVPGYQQVSKTRPLLFSMQGPSLNREVLTGNDWRPAQMDATTSIRMVPTPAPAPAPAEIRRVSPPTGGGGRGGGSFVHNNVSWVRMQMGV